MLAVFVDGFIESDGIRLAVRDHGGRGPSIVLVHGHLGNLAEYDVLAPLLAEHLRVVAYDQRGHGWSEAGPVGVAEFARDLGAVVSACGLDDPVVFGSSFGSLVALGYLTAGGGARAFINQDGHVADLPRPPAPRDAPVVERRVLPPPTWQAYLDGFGAFGPAGTATALRSALRCADGTVEVRPTAADLSAKEEAFGGGLGVVEAYERTATPVLVLAAEQGRPREDRERELAALAARRPIEVRWFGTGHWISAADPAAVAAAVVEFALGVDGSAAP